MAVSLAEFAQGEVKDFPPQYRMKWTFRSHRSGEQPFRFTLVHKGIEQEVEFVEEATGHGSFSNGHWYTFLVVCPVETLETRDGLRLIYVEVDPWCHAIYL